ncbi:MAG TPA: M23 family metallopeptidase [Longimicrobium sp.]
MHPSHRPLSGRLRRAAVACAALFLAACAGRTGAPSSSPWPSPTSSRGTAYVAPGASLAMPVRGIRPEQLRDTYADARSGGRVHHAIDIMASAGTPVLAAAEGTILKLRTGGLGGITIYQLGTDGRTLYYYAHLQRYAAGLREGLPIERGQVVAYVGDTGNAGAGNYHLHFSVSRLSDPRRWWEGENVNPYPMLAGVATRSREGR